jgi:hypothetical protein
MAFIINGKTLPQGVPFTDSNGNSYPANWLNLSTEQEKAAIGITEVADPVRADDRFYWDGDVANPKDIDQVKAMLISQSKATAGSMLSQSDWKIIRAVETNVSANAEVLAERAAIRTASNDNETAINACTTVDQLAVLQLVFPQKEVAPVAP